MYQSLHSTDESFSLASTSSLVLGAGTTTGSPGLQLAGVETPYLYVVCMASLTSSPP
ncbi:MAG: hypothetical protein RXR16_05650 [Thermocladium sp.]